MRIAIFGASGKTGTQAVAEARRRGHIPIAIVRAASAQRTRFHQSTEVRTCEVYEDLGVASSIAQADAVISCLGIRRRNALNPWSPLRSPPDTTARATANILRAMCETGIDRLACISAAGAGDSRARTTAPIRLLIDHSNMAPAYHDLEQMERALERSGVTWLALRPTTLTNAKRPTCVRNAERYALLSRVPRIAVANALLDFSEGKRDAETGTRLITA